jgi:hypothetical protein
LIVRLYVELNFSARMYSSMRQQRRVTRVAMQTGYLRR